MDQKTFASRIAAEPRLQAPFSAAQNALEPRSRATGIELVALGLLYPVALYLFKKIGLPWLNAAVQLSNAELAKFHAWLQERYKAYGFDPAKLEAAGDAMYVELCNIKSPIEQKLWEGFRDELLKNATEKVDES